jgi:hypothetical protein
VVHPKVKVPAIVGVIITVILAILSALTSVPALAPYVTIGLTIVTTISGYLTPADSAELAAARGRANVGVRGGKRDGTLKHR